MRNLGRDAKITLVQLAAENPYKEVLHSELFVESVTFEDFCKTYVGTLFHGKVFFPTRDETNRAKIVEGFKVSHLITGGGGGGAQVIFFFKL